MTKDPMTSVEQHKLIAELKEVTAYMTRDDADLFDMFRIRDKDDEDLDEMSRKKLREFHEKYIVARRPKGNPLDALFGKK